MMNLNVPYPKPEVQQNISEQIWQVEKPNITLDNEIDALYQKIDGILLGHLSHPTTVNI